jgi:hypothetical protein
MPENNLYHYFDFLLESNIPLPELAMAEQGRAGVSFSLQQPASEDKKVEWLHHWKNSEEVTISFTKTGDNYFLRFPNYADYILNRAGDSISCYPLDGIDTSLIRHFLLDQVLPRLISQQGKVVLHASAVALDGGAIVFVGESGSGKSTLASSFHRHGLPLLSDDCLQLVMAENGVECIPAYNGSRLWDDSFQAVFRNDECPNDILSNSGKKRLYLPSHQNNTTALPLTAMYFLARDPETSGPEAGVNETSIKSLNGSLAVMSLIKCAFMLDVTDREQSGRLFDNVSQLVRSGLPVYQLEYRRIYEQLPAVRQHILQSIGTGNMTDP